jgi:hypothetical protein
MSRGPGVMQRYLWQTIQTHGKPMTFAEIRSVAATGAILPGSVKLMPSEERSLRRALHAMVRDEALIALGAVIRIAIFSIRLSLSSLATSRTSKLGRKRWRLMLQDLLPHEPTTIPAIGGLGSHAMLSSAIIDSSPK